jgi:hypothetical protein
MASLVIFGVVIEERLPRIRNIRCKMVGYDKNFIGEHGLKHTFAIVVRADSAFEPSSDRRSRRDCGTTP